MYTPPTHAIPMAPTDEELQLEKAWHLDKVCAYAEIDLHVEDQECISIRTNHDPSVAWNMLKSMYGNRLANTRAALIGKISHFDIKVLEFWSIR